MYLSGNDKVVRGKKGSAGVHIFKTVQVIILYFGIIGILRSLRPPRWEGKEKYVTLHTYLE